MRWIIPGVIITLSFISIITLRSVAPNLAFMQMAYAVLGICVFGITWYIGFQQWSKTRWLAYTGLLILLLLTLLVAGLTRGTARWLDIWGIHIQGSQLAVPIVSLVLAHFVANQKLQSIKNIFLFLLISLAPAVFIVLAPDLGTTLILLISIFGIMFSSDLKMHWFIMGAGAALFIAIVAWNFFLAPYQKARITSFIQPSADIQGSGYNARQALIAVGSGQLFGRGLGQGVQSQLQFLPERHTDFIFASLAEEWGFIGATILLLLYTGLLGTYLFTVWHLKNGPEYYFLQATIFFFLFQILVNIGMNIQLLPITGITLPFVSYGGSSFIAFCFHCGLAQSIVSQKPTYITKHFQ